MKDVVIINPAGTKLGELSAIEPPYWCALIATQFKGNVEIIDAEADGLTVEEVAERVNKERPSLVIIIAMGRTPSTTSTTKMDVTIELAHKLKDVKLFIGGLHSLALPELTLKQTGAKGVLDFPSPNIMCQIPRVRWDLLPMEKYRAHNWHCLANLDTRDKYAAIYTSYGCPFSCGFCNIHTIYGGRGIYYRDISKVIQEIDYLVSNYGIRNLKICDELFVLQEERVLAFCDMLIERNYNLNIWAYSRTDTASSKMLNRMKKAGFNWVCYGIESASPSVRLGVNKTYKQDALDKIISMTQDAGIYILANLIFGLPDDNIETMEQTLDLASSYNFEWVNFYVAMDYPGSSLYSGSIPESWDEYNQLSPRARALATKYLTPREVLDFRDKAFISYFSNSNYLNMIKVKFGDKAVNHIEEMLKFQIR